MADPVWIDGSTPLNAVNMNKLQTRDEKTVANGYPSLDSTGKVPQAQLPIAALNWEDTGVTTPAYSGPSYATTLPASPVNGQEAVLVNSTTAPLYQWRFRYNTANSSAYKWEFIGGSHYTVSNFNIGTLSTASTWIAGSPGLVVPRTGTYQFGYSCCFTAPAQIVLCQLGLWLDPSGEINNTEALVTIPASMVMTAAMPRVQYTAAANAAFYMAYWTNYAGPTVNRAWLSVVPVAVS